MYLANNRKCTLDRQLWCWRAKSGNIDGVAGAVQLVQMVVLNIEITLLMQQMIVEMQLIKTVRINTRQYDTTKPIITPLLIIH
jgi:hypothetical protein